MDSTGGLARPVSQWYRDVQRVTRCPPIAGPIRLILESKALTWH